MQQLRGRGRTLQVSGLDQSDVVKNGQWFPMQSEPELGNTELGFLESRLMCRLIFLRGDERLLPK